MYGSLGGNRTSSTTPSSSNFVNRIPRTSSVSSSSSITKRRLTSINDGSHEWELQVKRAASDLLFHCCEEINLSIEDGLRSASKSLKQSKNQFSTQDSNDLIIKKISLECRQKCSSNIVTKLASKSVHKANFDPSMKMMEDYQLFPEIAIADASLEKDYQSSAIIIMKSIFDQYKDVIYYSCASELPGAVNDSQNLINAIEKIAREISVGCKELLIDTKKLARKLLGGQSPRRSFQSNGIKNGHTISSNGKGVDSENSVRSALLQHKSSRSGSALSGIESRKADPNVQYHQNESIVINDSSDEENLSAAGLKSNAAKRVKARIDLNVKKALRHSDQLFNGNDTSSAYSSPNQSRHQSSARSSPPIFPRSPSDSPPMTKPSSPIREVEQNGQYSTLEYSTSSSSSPLFFPSSLSARSSNSQNDVEVNTNGKGLNVIPTQLQEDEESEELSEIDELLSEIDDAKADSDYTPTISKKRKRGKEVQTESIKRPMRTIPHFDFGKVIEGSNPLSIDEILDRSYEILISNFQNAESTLVEFCINRSKPLILEQIKRGLLTGSHSVIEAFVNDEDLSIEDMQLLSRIIPRGGGPKVMLAMANWDLNSLEGSTEDYQWEEDGIHVAYCFIGTEPIKRLYKLKPRFLQGDVVAKCLGVCDDGTRLSQIALWRSPSDDREKDWRKEEFFQPLKEEKSLKTVDDVRNALVNIVKCIFVIACWTFHSNPKINNQIRQSFPLAKPKVGLNDELPIRCRLFKVHSKI